MSQLDRLIERKNVKIESTYGAQLDWNKQSDWQKRANGYTVVLRYQRRRLTCDFWQGVAHTSDPDAADVINSLCSEAGAIDQTFEEFCGDFGYDIDSRTEATYKACKVNGEKIRRLLGNDFDEFARAEH